MDISPTFVIVEDQLYLVFADGELTFEQALKENKCIPVNEECARAMIHTLENHYGPNQATQGR